MSHPVFKIINSEGCQSYLIGCPETREALLVDPKVGREGLYQAMLEHYDLKLVAVLDSHTHADHLSASTRLCGPRVELLMSHRTPVDRPMRKLAEGDEVELGNLRFQVLEVPGHTPDSLALYGEGLLFSGDSLFIGGLARADFVGSDPALLFESVRSQLLSLPGETLVLPGHGYNDILFSTIDAEKQLNEALQFPDGEAYAKSLNATPGAGNSEGVNANLKLNLEREPELPESPGNVAACCASPGGGTKVSIEEAHASRGQAIRDSLASPGQWVDVRDPFEYAHGRIPGTTNIPLSELGFHLDELRTGDPLYLSCRSGVRSMTAAKTLQRLGIATHPVNIGGGILGWQDQGFAIEGQPAT